VLRSIQVPALVAALLVAAIASFAPPAAGQSYGESAADFVQPRITQQQFRSLLEAMNFDRDQKTIAQALYSDYASAIDAAIQKADEAADRAGRQTVEQALAGRVRLPVEQLREMRASVLKAYTSVWSAADAALDDLLFGVETLATPAQQQQAQSEILAMRRAIYLAPRRVNEYSSEYAGEGVNVLRLIDDARAEDGELASLSDRDLQPLRQRYVQQLDALLEETASQLRSARLEQRIARIRRDNRARRNAAAKVLQPWQRLYNLNRRTVNAIGELIDAPADRQRWQHRFDRACFPWLLQDERPDRMHAWLAQQTLPQQTWTQIEQAYAHYRQRRRALADTMIELIVQARLTRAVPLHPMMDPAEVPDEAADLYEQLLKLTGEQTAARNQAVETIESLLSSTQRRDMQRALR